MTELRVGERVERQVFYKLLVELDGRQPAVYVTGFNMHARFHPAILVTGTIL